MNIQKNEIDFKGISEEKLLGMFAKYIKKENNKFAVELSDDILTELLKRTRKRGIYNINKKKFYIFKQLLVNACLLTQKYNASNITQDLKNELNLIVNHGKFKHSAVTITTSDLGCELNGKIKNTLADMMTNCDTFSFYNGGMSFSVGDVLMEVK